MALTDDLDRIAGAVAGQADEGERVIGVIPAEPTPGVRLYLCSFQHGEEERTWLVVDDDAAPVTDRNRIRETVSIAALCEIADESAAGGDLEGLRSQLLSVRVTENPPGIGEAEEAAHALEATLAPPPRLATPAYLDAVGEATMRLERALGESSSSPFAEAMRLARVAVEELTEEVERNYRTELP